MRIPPVALIRIAAYAALASLTPVSKGISEEALVTKTDLFKGGEDGFALYRIPGIVVTPKGSVLAYCEARKNSGSDWGEIQIQARRSVDGGRTWSPAAQIAHMGERVEGNPHKPSGGEHEQTVNNPVAIADHRAGCIHFLYCINYARCFYMVSKDDGLTFSAPVEITKAFETFRAVCDWKVLATGPGHGLQLKNGRLVVPVWLAYGKPGDHSPSMSGTIYSDDHGQTWQAGEIALPNTKDWKNPNETALAELSDGRVMLNARTVSLASRRLVTISPDGVSGWSKPQFDPALLDPQCMGSLIRIPGGGPRGRLLFSHPHSLKYDEGGAEVPGAHGPRKNLCIQISTDDGQTWSLPKTLEGGSSAYSDLAVLLDGTTLCFYERRSLLTVARIAPEWLDSAPPTAEPPSPQKSALRP